MAKKIKGKNFKATDFESSAKTSVLYLVTPELQESMSMLPIGDWKGTHLSVENFYASEFQGTDSFGNEFRFLEFRAKKFSCQLFTEDSTEDSTEFSKNDLAEYAKLVSENKELFLAKYFKLAFENKEDLDVMESLDNSLAEEFWKQSEAEMEAYYQAQYEEDEDYEKYKRTSFDAYSNAYGSFNGSFSAFFNTSFNAYGSFNAYFKAYASFNAPFNGSGSGYFKGNKEYYQAYEEEYDDSYSNLDYINRDYTKEFIDFYVKYLKYINTNYLKNMDAKNFEYMDAKYFKDENDFDNEYNDNSSNIIIIIFLLCLSFFYFYFVFLRYIP